MSQTFTSAMGGDFNPGDPHHFQYYDSYFIKGLLEEGKNVIGVICHNYAIGSSLVTHGSWWADSSI